MRIYHQLGHNHKWALDSHFENAIGDGFIFTAYTFKHGSVGGNISGYKPSQYLDKCMFDLQYYGSRESVGGNLGTYSFNPINMDESESTHVHGFECIKKGIDYQIAIGLREVIIPIFYYDASNVDRTIEFIKRVNKKIEKIKGNNPEVSFFMTVPFSNNSIVDSDSVEKILQIMTDISIVFDGYYIVCDYNPEYKKKISVDYSYYANLLRVFRVLNKQGFKTIYGYANWDALIFNALTDIDTVTIGTYENLRRFNIKRFTESVGGGASKGWYFSEKLLNFVRAEELTNLRASNCLDLIANEKNIFSDFILDPKFLWNTHKPDVHKNYLLAISRMLAELGHYKSIKERGDLLLKKVESARNLYAKLAKDYKVYLNDESSDYHLATWSSFLQKNIAH